MKIIESKLREKLVFALYEILRTEIPTIEAQKQASNMIGCVEIERENRKESLLRLGFEEHLAEEIVKRSFPFIK